MPDSVLAHIIKRIGRDISRVTAQALPAPYPEPPLYEAIFTSGSETGRSAVLVVVHSLFQPSNMLIQL